MLNLNNTNVCTCMHVQYMYMYNITHYTLFIIYLRICVHYFEKCRYHIFIHVHALTVCTQSIFWFSTIVVLIIKWIKSLEVIFSFYLFSSLCTNKFLCYSSLIVIIRNPECGSLYSTLIYNMIMCFVTYTCTFN